VVSCEQLWKDRWGFEGSENEVETLKEDWSGCEMGYMLKLAQQSRSCERFLCF